MVNVTENEKLCYAVINNSDLNKISWEGVCNDLGIEKVGAAQKRWSRFKQAVAANNSGNGATASTADSTPAKKSKAGTKKRVVADMNDGEDIESDQTPAKKFKKSNTKNDVLATKKGSKPGAKKATEENVTKDGDSEEDVKMEDEELN